MIRRLIAFDFDGTLIDSPDPENGKQFWQDKMGRAYPHLGWWGRPESLDLDVFEIKPFPSVLTQLKKEIVIPGSFVIVLTSRMEKLRPQVQAVLDANNIHVDKLDMKRSNKTKGEKILRYVQELPDLKVINVYEDRDIDIESYESIRNQIPNGIEFNVYLANRGTLALTESSRSRNVLCIIQEEIKKIII